MPIQGVIELYLHNKVLSLKLSISFIKGVLIRGIQGKPRIVNEDPIRDLFINKLKYKEFLKQLAIK